MMDNVKDMWVKKLMDTEFSCGFPVTQDVCEKLIEQDKDVLSRIDYALNNANFFWEDTNSAVSVSLNDIPTEKDDNKTIIFYYKDIVIKTLISIRNALAEHIKIEEDKLLDLKEGRQKCSEVWTKDEHAEDQMEIKQMCMKRLTCNGCKYSDKSVTYDDCSFKRPPFLW